MIAFLIVAIIFGFPAGILVLLAEAFITYNRKRETEAKMKDELPPYQKNYSKEGIPQPRFSDFQKMTSGTTNKSSNASKTEYEYTYTSNGTKVETPSGKTEKIKTYAAPVQGKYVPRKTRRRAKGAAIACFAVSGATFLAATSDIFEGIAANGFRDLTQYAESVPMLIISIGCLIAGLWIVLSKQRKEDKENRYTAIINQGYGMIPIDNISYLYPKRYEDCVKDLQEMINSGSLPGAYIDYGRRLLVIDPLNKSVEPLIKKNGKAAENGGNHASAASDGAKPAKKKSEADRIDFLSLERLSKKVTDDDIRMKLERISSTLKTIGQKAEEDPEIKKAAGLDSFMEMYLPKTIKLVEDYEELNREASLPEDNELKTNVLETLDAIDNAAMTLWKDIIHSDMIDISAELDALQTKLVMDGYSESDFSRPGSNAAKAYEHTKAQEFDFSDMDPSADSGQQRDTLPEPGQAVGEDVFSKIRKEQEKEKEQVH